MRAVRVPLGWLREYVEVPWDAEELAERLTWTGLKVESIDRLGEELAELVAARILEILPHPRSRALWVCRLEDGQAIRQVVTGAAGLAAGQVVAYARPGAVLPGGRRIGSQRFGGELSEGMLLTATELVLGEEHREGEGILALPSGLAPGTDLVEYFGLRDTVLELELTVNYAVHCQSMVGVAREVAALTGGEVRLPPEFARSYQPAMSAGEDAHGEAAVLTSVRVEDAELCPRYTAILLRDVRPAFSPVPIQFRLHAAGMRPLGAVVDVTNYVMLELGQPLHAFDLARLEEHRIVVRRARPGERLRTLDGQERELTEEMLVIADACRPVGLAGVMGGEDTEVTSTTREVLMEAAWFHPVNIRRTSRQLGLRTGAAARFEKGIDPAGVLAASRRACCLLEEMGVARVVPGAIDVRSCPYGPRQVQLRPARVHTLLGLDIPPPQIRQMLVRLGFAVSPPGSARVEAPPGDGTGGRWRAASEGARDGRGQAAAEGGEDERWEVAVPTWRGDVVGEIDLIEEVARIYGYERIPSTLPAGSPAAGYLTREQRLIGRARQVLAAAGFSEALTFSLISPEAFDRLGLQGDDPRRRALTVRNPLSVEWSVLRTSLIPGLLDCLAHNQAHRVPRAGLFEISAVYLPRELPPRELPAERLHVAGVAYGPWREGHWSGDSPETDYFLMKGVVEYLLDALGVGPTEFTRAGEPFLHPGRQARVTVGEHLLGVVGELHPRAARAHEVEGRVAVFELDFTAILALATEERRYRPLPRYPAVSRDVAFMLADHIPAARAEEVIRRHGGPFLESLRLFDVYRGEGILPGHRSLAYSLVYRSPEKTLTDREVDEIHAGVRRALEVELGATLR